jgi:uncharacterized membrane protein
MVLLLFSHHFFSKYYQQPAIFKNALIGTVVQIAGNVIGSIIITVALGAAALSGSLGEFEPENFQQISSMIFESSFTIIGGIIIFAAVIIGFYFLYQALKQLAEVSGVKLFKTAGLLYFIGGIGLIAFFLGALVMLVAWIIHIVAYFSIPREQEQIKEPV